MKKFVKMINGLYPLWKKIGQGFFPYEWRQPRIWEKKFPHESRMAHFIFPMNGLAGVVKINFPMSGEATNGEIYFHHDC